MTSELAGARTQLETADGSLDLYSLPWLAEAGIADVSRLPHTGGPSRPRTSRSCRVVS